MIRRTFAGLPPTSKLKSKLRDHDFTRVLEEIDKGIKIESVLRTEWHQTAIRDLPPKELEKQRSLSDPLKMSKDDKSRVDQTVGRACNNDALNQ